MFDIFGSVKNFIKFHPVCIDDFVFRLHYRATFVLLLIFSLVVTANQYIGDPIDCIVDHIPQDTMDTYCWIYSTFTIPSRLDGRIGYDVVQPGVAGFVQNEDEVQHHKYYQWVCFALFFQAMLFYLPHYIWKSCDGGKIKMLAMDLTHPKFDEDDENNRTDLLVAYLHKYRGQHCIYALQYIVCDFLNLVNVIGQIFFIDWFLDGEFSTYGWDVWHFTEQSPDIRDDPMSRVFPTVTKCTFHKYGPSGSVQKFDGLCVLPLNIVNEKIYLVLWFWFIILSIVTGLFLIYLTLLIFIRNLQFYSINFFNGTHINNDDLNEVIRNFGDWFLFYQLSDNIDPFIFNHIIEKLKNKING